MSKYAADIERLKDINVSEKKPTNVQTLLERQLCNNISIRFGNAPTQTHAQS